MGSVLKLISNMGLLSILQQRFLEERCRPYHYDNRSRLYLPFLIGRESVACFVNQFANEVM